MIEITCKKCGRDVWEEEMSKICSDCSKPPVVEELKAKPVETKKVEKKEK